MKLLILISNFNPEISFTPLDFQAFLDKLTAEFIWAIVFFFALILASVIIYTALSYLGVLWSRMFGLKNNIPELQINFKDL